jgi:hypothetical protein
MSKRLFLSKFFISAFFACSMTHLHIYASAHEADQTATPPSSPLSHASDSEEGDAMLYRTWKRSAHTLSSTSNRDPSSSIIDSVAKFIMEERGLGEDSFSAAQSEAITMYTEICGMASSTDEILRALRAYVVQVLNEKK